MQLSSYLKRRGFTQQAFAERLSAILQRRVTQGAISRIVRGRYVPRPDVLAAIESATGRAVRASSFLDPLGGTVIIATPDGRTRRVAR